MIWLAACADPGATRTEPPAPTVPSRTEPLSPSMGGQIGESSTPTVADRGLVWVPGPAACTGGSVGGLAAGEIVPRGAEYAIGGRVADLGGALAITGLDGAEPRVWVVASAVLATSGSLGDAQATIDPGSVDPRPLAAGDLTGDGAAELAVPDDLGQVVLYDGGEPWAVLLGSGLGDPVPMPGGVLLVPHDGGLAVLTGLTGGAVEVDGGVALPAGANGVSVVGDIDGDKVPDLWIAGDGTGWWVDGGAALGGRAVVLAELAGADQVLGIGDPDGDGFGDCVVRSGGSLAVVPGAAVAAGSVELDRWDAGATGPLQVGDLDGDGTAEVVTPTGGGWRVIDPATRSVRSSVTEDRPDAPSVVHVISDLDGDGTAELVFGRAPQG